MPGGSSQTSSQTSTSGPWPAAQPYLKDAMGQASGLLENKKGFKPYPGQSWVPFSDQSQAGLSGMMDTARAGNPFYSGAADVTKGMMTGAFDADTSGFKGLLGGGPTTGADFRSMYGSVDPNFEGVVQSTANDVGDQIQRQFGGASYGSGSNADYLTKGVGDVVSRMRSDNFYNNESLKRGLLNDITGVEQQRFANDRGLLGDIANTQMANVGTRMAGVSAAPGVYDMAYSPYDRMMQVGGAYEGKAGEKLQAKMDKWETKTMAPWDRLTQAFGIFSGTGAQGSRTQSSVSQPTDIWSKLLGGGLLASQFLG